MIGESIQVFQNYEQRFCATLRMDQINHNLITEANIVFRGWIVMFGVVKDSADFHQWQFG